MRPRLRHALTIHAGFPGRLRWKECSSTRLLVIWKTSPTKGGRRAAYIISFHRRLSIPTKCPKTDGDTVGHLQFNERRTNSGKVRLIARGGFGFGITRRGIGTYSLERITLGSATTDAPFRGARLVQLSRSVPPLVFVGLLVVRITADAARFPSPWL